MNQNNVVHKDESQCRAVLFLFQYFIDIKRLGNKRSEISILPSLYIKTFLKQTMRRNSVFGLARLHFRDRRKVVGDVKINNLVSMHIYEILNASFPAYLCGPNEIGLC